MGSFPPITHRKPQTHKRKTWKQIKMGSYQDLADYQYDAGLYDAAGNDPSTTNSLFLGVFITLIPKLLPRIMPVFMTNSAPEIKAKFDTPDFVENNEEMLKDEFIKYFQIVEDIVDTFDGTGLKKSSEYSGFQRFLLGCLESLDIDVTRFIGSLKLDRVRHLGAIARGTAPNSVMYNIIADTIIKMGEFIYNSMP